MVRRKNKVQRNGDELPPWLLTFSDMVTLLMTFFIMLVSMASLTDDSKRKVALGSVAGTFGAGAPGLDDLTTIDGGRRVDPGPINVFKDLAPVRQHLIDDPDKDLRFESNRFIQRLSMNADALFRPGSAELTDEGRKLLDRVRPVVAESAFPLGLSGHTSQGIEELGPDYVPKPWIKVDFSWGLSLGRVLSVYRYFIDSGISPDKLRVEAFGRYKPRVASEGADARSNRRVEITLDRRIGSWDHEVANEVRQGEGSSRKEFKVKDFLFRFDLPEKP